MSLLPFITEFLSPVQRAEKLLALNERIAPYGLRLSAADAVALVRSGDEALRSAGRMELGDGVAPQLVDIFCDSPYLSQEDYAETLCELTALFYQAKSLTADKLSDLALLQWMKRAFDGECAGSLDRLAGDALPALARRLNGAPQPSWVRTDD